jgi:hypothetical protein
MGKVDWSRNVYDGLLYGLAINGHFKKVEVGLDSSYRRSGYLQ